MCHILGWNNLFRPKEPSINLSSSSIGGRLQLLLSGVVHSMHFLGTETLSCTNRPAHLQGLLGGGVQNPHYKQAAFFHLLSAYRTH